MDRIIELEAQLEHCDHTIANLREDLKRDTTPLPCGHPSGCVVSAPPFAPGMVTTCHCGWCAAEADLEGSIEFNRDVAAENLKLEADRNALCEKLKAAEELAEALGNVKNMIDADGPPSLEWLSISTYLETDVVQALAAWKEANDDVS